jgi:methylated-DNA-protein-cysteine methyltransferase related protein
MMEDSFFGNVIDIVKQIPVGRVTTFGAIARCLGTPKSSRMVGWALNSTKFRLEEVPAHRVVNRSGLLTGKIHFGDNQTMQHLLEAEGVLVKDNQIVKMENYFWDPFTELIK